MSKQHDGTAPAPAPAAVAPSKALLACSMRTIDMAKRAVLAAAVRTAITLNARTALNFPEYGEPRELGKKREERREKREERREKREERREKREERQRRRRKRQQAYTRSRQHG